MDDKETLARILELTEKNHRILRTMRRVQFWGGVWRVVYWAIAVGIAIGAFYYLRPIIDTATRVFDTVRGQSTSSAMMIDFDALRKLVK